MGGFRIEIAVPGPTDVRPQSVLRKQSPLVFEEGGVSAWSDTPCISLGPHGRIFGHLFTRSLPGRRVERLNEAAIENIACSGGRSLLRDYWGGYVALIVEQSGRACVLRDPSGALPCFMRQKDGVVVFASDASELVQAAATAPVDFLEVGRFLSAPYTAGPRTCLTDVDELIAGSCCVVTRTTVRTELWWSPQNFLDVKARPSDTAADELREIVIDCVRCWSACFDHILLGVSGGLDSSIVAAAARLDSAHLRCLTMVGPDPAGDERRHAQELTDWLGLSLISEDYNLDDIAVDRATLGHLPWPVAGYFSQGIAAAHDRLLADAPIGAFFTGNGGDNVFCSLRSAAPLVDRYMQEGLSSGVIRTLHDLCILTESDVITVLGAAWQRYRRRYHGHRTVANFAGLAPAMVARIQPTDGHPWLDLPRSTLPGKVAHLALIARAHAGLELYPRACSPPQISPLLAQPIVELCLRIPTWQWIEAGRNRAVARRAFQDVLPSSLLRRTSKGGPTGVMLDLFERDAAKLISLLRDGLLMAEGVLDANFLELPHDPSWRGTPRVQRLLALGAAECWTRHWFDVAARQRSDQDRHPS